MGRGLGPSGRNLTPGGGGSVSGLSTSSAKCVSVKPLPAGEGSVCGALSCHDSPEFVVDHPEYVGDRVVCEGHALDLVEKVIRSSENQPAQARESGPEAPSPSCRRKAGTTVNARHKGVPRTTGNDGGEPQRRLSDWIGEKDGDGESVY
jgi:hypothetical protein